MNLSEKTSREILLVEDIEETVVGLTLDLELRGTTVHSATSRRSASEFLHDSVFAAVLVDLNIPEIPGSAPSPEHGRGLIVDMTSGALGGANVGTPFMLLTAQSIDVRPSEFSDHAGFLAVGSKVGDSRWLFRTLVAARICDRFEELDFDFDDVLRERIQIVVTSTQRDHATVDIPDLGFESVLVPLTRFTPALRRTVVAASSPLVLWAIGNVSAATAEGVDPREFSLSKEQISPQRDYASPDWLN